MSNEQAGALVFHQVSRFEPDAEFLEGCLTLESSSTDSPLMPSRVSQSYLMKRLGISENTLRAYRKLAFDHNPIYREQALRRNPDYPQRRLERSQVVAKFLASNPSFLATKQDEGLTDEEIEEEVESYFYSQRLYPDRGRFTRAEAEILEWIAKRMNLYRDREQVIEDFNLMFNAQASV